MSTISVARTAANWPNLDPAAILQFFMPTFPPSSSGPAIMVARPKPSGGQTFPSRGTLPIRNSTVLQSKRETVEIDTVSIVTTL